MLARHIIKVINFFIFGDLNSALPGFVSEAIVEATANYDKPEVLAEVSKGLGQAMKGIEMSTLTQADRMQDRGI